MMQGTDEHATVLEFDSWAHCIAFSLSLTHTCTVGQSCLASALFQLLLYSYDYYYRFEMADWRSGRGKESTSMNIEIKVVGVVVINETL
jgi:hypothetical protein